MAWVLLVLSGVFEAVWATALVASNGLRRPKPTALFIVALMASMAGLAHAMNSIPAGTAYAIWVGIGASLVVLWGIFRGSERGTPARYLILALLVGSVVGLKLVS